MHSHLSLAKINKDDEYYTRKEDIESELPAYQSYIEGKVLYFNCDDEDSPFLEHFFNNYNYYKYKKIYATGINGIFIKFDGNRTKKNRIDGDFRSESCKRILAKSDIVITNPPFSLFRQWLKVIGTKDFIVIGNKNAISYKDFFPQIKSGRVKLGYTRPNLFHTPDGTLKNLSGLCRWFTTLPVVGKPMHLQRKKVKETYERFDLYPAINVDRVEEIPDDYEELMGVPITFLDIMDYSKYEIVDLIARYAVLNDAYDVKGHQLTEIKGIPRYSRLIIKKKSD